MLIPYLETPKLFEKSLILVTINGKGEPLMIININDLKYEKINLCDSIFDYGNSNVQLITIDFTFVSYGIRSPKNTIYHLYK